MTDLFEKVLEAVRVHMPNSNEHEHMEVVFTTMVSWVETEDELNALSLDEMKMAEDENSSVDDDGDHSSDGAYEDSDGDDVDDVMEREEEVEEDEYDSEGYLM